MQGSYSTLYTERRAVGEVTETSRPDTVWEIEIMSRLHFNRKVTDEKSRGGRTSADKEVNNRWPVYMNWS